MDRIDKYQNLQLLLPKLSPVLFESIQQDVLNIQAINLSCIKYSSACANHPKLKYSEYVIYSPYVNREHRKYESFIFVNNQGEITCHLNGQEMKLYGMIHPISELHENEEYFFNHSNIKNQSIPHHKIASS